MSNLIEIANDILKQVNIVEIISHYSKLHKKGRNYEALCPFHDDTKLGNFYVSEEKQIFKCFSCNKAGNAINFVQYRENLSFIDALRKVCEISNIHDPRLEEKTTKKSIDPDMLETLNCLKDINNFYQVSLKQSEDSIEANKYLSSRGLTDSIIKRFNIGVSQNNGENIIKYLTSKGYSLKTIENTGICNLDSKIIKDVNAGRITFGIANKEGNIVGFSARIYGKYHSDAKYVNTRETKCFVKSKILYNYDQAIHEARRVGYVYVLEGFMDVIAAYKIGINSAVALMGTALTKEQIQLLRYLNVEIRLCLDLDEPGQINTEKIIKMFDEAGLKYTLVNNNQHINEKDCDEILTKHNEDYLRKYLNNLISKGEWLLNYYSRSLNLNSLEGKKKLLANFIPILATTKSDLDLIEYLKRISQTTGFDEKTIKGYVQKYKNRNNVKNNLNSKDLSDIVNYENHKKTKLENAERAIIRYVLRYKEALSLYDNKLGYLCDEKYREIISYIEEYIASDNSKNYDAQSIISFISFCKGKDSIINEITNISLEDISSDPFSEERFDEIVKTINEERENSRGKQALTESSIGKSSSEQAAQAAAFFKKKKKGLENK